MCPYLKESKDFYYELRDEVRDRVKRGIAAVATERFRVMIDSQPPWGFLTPSDIYKDKNTGDSHGFDYG